MIKGKTILITSNCQCLKLRNMWNVGTSDLPREPDNCTKGNWQYTSIPLRKGEKPNKSLEEISCSNNRDKPAK